MKSLNKIACFLMLCWMVVIFMFSAEPDTESSELSGSVSYRIVSVVNTITASHGDEKELLNKAELIDYPLFDIVVLALQRKLFDSDRRDLPICLHR